MPAKKNNNKNPLFFFRNEITKKMAITSVCCLLMTDLHC